MLWLVMYTIALIPFAKYASIGQKANDNGEDHRTIFRESNDHGAFGTAEDSIFD